MNNIQTLARIIDTLKELESNVTDTYVKAATQTLLIKYKLDYNSAMEQNALDVVRYKIKHLTDKLER